MSITTDTNTMSILRETHWTDDQVAVWSHISWSAVIVGVAIALATQLLLSILGAGIGFTVIGHDVANAEQMTRSSLAVGLWWIVTSVIAIYVGAWSASELAPPGTERSGALQGLVVWALATVLGMLLAGALISGVAARVYAVTGTPTLAFNSFGSSASVSGGSTVSERNTGNANQPPRGDNAQQERLRVEMAAKASARASFMLFVGGLLGAIAAAFGGVHNRKVRIDRYKTHLTPRPRTPVL